MSSLKSSCKFHSLIADNVHHLTLHHYSFFFSSFIIQFNFVCIFTPVLQPVSVQALCSLLSCICWFSNNVPRAFGGRCIGGLVCLGRDMSRWLSGHAWPSLLCLCVQLYIYSWEVLVSPVYSTLKNCESMLSLLKYSNDLIYGPLSMENVFSNV